jgi:tungstate transport system substrate-binding protein
MKKTFKIVLLIAVITGLFILPAMAGKVAQKSIVLEKEIILATTTSTQDSGLLDYLIPIFEKQYGNKIKVKVIAVGSGQAIKLGEDGNADVLLVHSRKSEDKFVADGFGIKAADVMANTFFVVGPENDPAGIAQAKSATEALQKIFDSKAKFISRGDDSGTDKKEKALWVSAKLVPAGEWYISAGQGMGKTLQMAEEMQAYTLVDEATFLTNKTGLKNLFQNDKSLGNPYGIIQVKSTKRPRAANELMYFFESPKGQKLIGDFGKAKFGKSIFVPGAKLR